MKILKPTAPVYFTKSEVRRRAKQEMERTGLSAKELLALGDTTFKTSTYTYGVQDITRIWFDLNIDCFEGRLIRPKIIVAPDLDVILGATTQAVHTTGAIMQTPDQKFVMYFCDWLGRRELHYVVGHEMVHQYIIQTQGMEAALRIAHGPEFMKYESWLKRSTGMRLLPGNYKRQGLDTKFSNTHLLS